MKSRVINNVKYGILSQIVKILLQFFNRKIFIYFLGVELLGVNSLFASILSILSMTELGVGSAIAFSLYKPLAENDIDKVKGIMCLFKRVYRIIGIVVLAVGCCLIPFIPDMVNTSEAIPYVKVMFFIVLLKTALTYLLFAYSQTLLIAAECKYEVDKIITLFYVITNVAEIIFLLCTKNFIVYLIVEMICLITQQYVIYRRAKQKYPDIMDAKNVNLAVGEKKEIWKNVYGLSINKFSGAILSSIDNVILSAFISTAIVGIYSNYTMILMAATGIISMAFTSVTANIGKKFADNSICENHFYLMLYMNFLICGFCSVLYFTLISDFVSLSFGKDLILSEASVAAIIFNMIMSYMTLAIQVFKDASGIFWFGKYRPVLTCVLNIAFSLLLVKPMGITGVVLATAFSRICTTVWYDPHLVFKYAFNKSAKNYGIRYIFYCIVIAVAILIIRSIMCIEVFTLTSVPIFVLKTILSCAISIVVMLGATIWMKEPKQLIRLVKGQVRK